MRFSCHTFKATTEDVAHSDRCRVHVVLLNIDTSSSGSKNCVMSTRDKPASLLRLGVAGLLTFSSLRRCHRVECNADKPRQHWPNQSGMEALNMSDCPQAAGGNEINVGNRGTEKTD